MTGDAGTFTEADLRAAVRRSGEGESYVQALLADMRGHREPLVLPPDEPAATGAAARTFGAVATKPCGCGPDEPCAAHAEAAPPMDTTHALTGAPDGTQERTGAVPPDVAESVAFWLMTDAEEGDIILSAPCADTLGCLWSHRASAERVTLGELIAAAGAHTGMAAGQAHAALARATGETQEGSLNDGNPVIWSGGSSSPYGWVCAVPAPGNPDHICGMPVESGPCGRHGEAGRD